MIKRSHELNNVHYEIKMSGEIKYFTNNRDMQNYVGKYLLAASKICEYRTTDIIKQINGMNIYEAKKKKKQIKDRYKGRILT